MSNIEYLKVWREARRKAHKCLRCGKPVVVGRVHCVKHMKEARKRHQDRKKKGFCYRCASSIDKGRSSVACAFHVLEEEKRRRRLRKDALSRIAAYYQREVGCLVDLVLPKRHPLKSFPCYGDLWIEHLNGSGRKDPYHRKGGITFHTAIITGKRSVKDLSILCMLHQLYNQSNARRRASRRKAFK